ncbi:MAG TPA: SCO family protein [Burkholderiales bacterium]
MSGYRKRIALALLALAPGWALPLQSPAHESARDAGSPKAAIEPVQGAAAKAGTRDARAYFTDLELLTQDGRKVRFYSDMLEGRTVLINVIYTSCKDACPLITQHLKQVRALVGERFGREVHFVTLTSDPERDSPAALKAFAQDQSVDLSGWTFLTGRKQNVDHILRKLGQFSQNVEEHSTLLIAGNVPAKRWSKIRPDSPPLAIAERLKLLADAGAPVPAPAR